MITKPQTKIHILVAESFELVRIGLRSIFENNKAIRLVAETSQLEKLFNLAIQYKPDVILMDLYLSGNHYTEHISQLQQSSPKSKILAFSHHNTEQTHLRVFRSGAAGIISKSNSKELLLKAIHAIHSGNIWFDRNITKLLWQAQFDSPSDPDSATEIEPQTGISTIQQFRLSDAERHIAYLACKGLSAKEISSQLSVTEKTVRNQLSVIYRKIGVKKQIELCLKAPLYNYFKASYLIGTFNSKNNEI